MLENDRALTSKEWDKYTESITPEYLRGFAPLELQVVDKFGIKTEQRVDGIDTLMINGGKDTFELAVYNKERILSMKDVTP